MECLFGVAVDTESWQWCRSTMEFYWRWECGYPENGPGTYYQRTPRVAPTQEMLDAGPPFVCQEQHDAYGMPPPRPASAPPKRVTSRPPPPPARSPQVASATGEAPTQLLRMSAKSSGARPASAPPRREVFLAAEPGQPHLGAQLLPPRPSQVPQVAFATEPQVQYVASATEPPVPAALSAATENTEEEDTAFWNTYRDPTPQAPSDFMNTAAWKTWVTTHTRLETFKDFTDDKIVTVLISLKAGTRSTLM